MEERYSRTAALIGEEALSLLKSARVMVIGLGGVGGYAVEALARAGIGTLALVDGDKISESNINRQIIADYTTVGKYKADAFAERIKNINPECRVACINEFITADNITSLSLSDYDFVIDAIDTVSTKLALAEICEAENINLIASMGTGNKLNPSGFEITDIYKTSVCPLARVMRTELKKRGVKKLTVLYSKEEPMRAPTPDGAKSRTPASISFVPSSAGLTIAGYVIRKIIGAV